MDDEGDSSMEHAANSANLPGGGVGGKSSINNNSKGGNNNKPKALEFWESMENLERNDFRYNTIHRMSVGRRMLPKPPSANENSHSRKGCFLICEYQIEAANPSIF